MCSIFFGHAPTFRAIYCRGTDCCELGFRIQSLVESLFFASFSINPVWFLFLRFMFFLIRALSKILCRSKLRSLIIDMQPPTFGKLTKEIISKIGGMLKELNKDQARAVIKALLANDFAVIEGFPGSGLQILN